MRLFIAIGAGLLGSSAVAAAPAPPEALIHRLYAAKDMPISHRAFTRYFSADLTRAYWRDRAAADRRHEVPLLDGDFRYDAQDFEITELAIATVSTGPERAEVAASFRNFGKPTKIRYTLCRRANGAWRIMDVSMPSGGLRDLYHLPPALQSPGC
jgi:hypothetical protein